ncbi:MAG: DUF502 domain-containing protein [Hyphomicrobiaceae bacterium]
MQGQSAGPHGSDHGGRGELPEQLARLADPETSPVPLHFGPRLRNYFLTGLVIVGPLAITVWVVLWFIGFVDAWVRPLMPDFEAWLRELIPVGYYPAWLVSSPVIGVLFAVVAITLIGALAANLLGRTIVSYGEMMLGRMPVVRNVYSGLKQIFETVLSESGNSFQKVGLVEFPRKGMWSIVFIAGASRGEVDVRLSQDEPTVCAFLPCTPNPTTGYLIYVPKNEVIELDMSIEEAAKLVISAGLIAPEFKGGGDLPAMAGAALKSAGGPRIAPKRG